MLHHHPKLVTYMYRLQYQPHQQEDVLEGLLATLDQLFHVPLPDSDSKRASITLVLRNENRCLGFERRHFAACLLWKPPSAS